MEWVANTKGSLPKELISDSIFPRVYSWIKRFHTAVDAARATGPKVTSMAGSEAAKQILHSEFAESEVAANTADAQDSVRKGVLVEVFPTDTGSSHRDKGVLVGLTEREIIIDLENGLRLHTPRTNYRVRPAGSKI